MKKQLNRIAVLFMLEILFGLAVVGMALISFAWFTGIWKSSSAVGFTTGNKPTPDCSIWIYDDEYDNLQTIGWRNTALTDDGADGYRIPGVDYTQTDGLYTFDFSSLQLGVIENLGELKDNNIFYLCFTVSPVANGTNVSILVNRAQQNYITIYNDSGALLSESEYASLYSALNETDSSTPLIAAAYAVSNVELSPDDNGFSELDFSAGEVSFENPEAISLNLSEPVPEDYYLYIRLNPNLDNFSIAARYLNSYMPCTMTFDISMELEIY